MSEKFVVVLEDIADKLEETMECWEQYLNTATGEFIALSDGSYAETDEKLAEEIDCSDAYVRLPNQYDIHEYSIMESFAAATKNAIKQEKLYRALRGKKPYRHFKDTLNYIGLDEAYYAFRFLAHIEIARRWCEDHEIPYIMRKEDCNLKRQEV